jgi:hypothetical protein
MIIIMVIIAYMFILAQRTEKVCHPRKSKKKRVKNGLSSGNRKMAYNLGIYAVTNKFEKSPRSSEIDTNIR